jgi:hypothetical protein
MHHKIELFACDNYITNGIKPREKERDRQIETEARTSAIRRCRSTNGTRPSPKGSKRQHRTEKFARSRDWTPSINQTWSHLALLIAPFRASCLYPNPSIPILMHHHHPPTRDPHGPWTGHQIPVPYRPKSVTDLTELSNTQTFQKNYQISR